MLNSPVLILNQNYEPLSVCRVRRAIVLALKGRAEVLETNSSVVRSPTFSVTSPSVLRLVHLVKRPRPRARLTRRRVFIRDGYICQYCGKQVREPTLDHVVPRHLNGAHSWGNVVSACKACNHRKAGRTPEEAGMKLLRRPSPPSAGSQFTPYPFHRLPEWGKYVVAGDVPGSRV